MLDKETLMSYSTSLNHSIVILDIRPYKNIIFEKIKEQCDYFNIRETQFEDIFDYCIARTISVILDLFVKGRVLNLPHNDMARIICDALSPTLTVVIQNVLSGYKIVLKPKEKVKVMCTYDEIILIRYF
jgi:hypothetical protein